MVVLRGTRGAQPVAGLGVDVQHRGSKPSPWLKSRRPRWTSKALLKTIRLPRLTSSDPRMCRPSSVAQQVEVAAQVQFHLAVHDVAHARRGVQPQVGQPVGGHRGQPRVDGAGRLGEVAGVAGLQDLEVAAELRHQQRVGPHLHAGDAGLPRPLTSAAQVRDRGDQEPVQVQAARRRSPASSPRKVSVPSPPKRPCSPSRPVIPVTRSSSPLKRPRRTRPRRPPPGCAARSRPRRILHRALVQRDGPAGPDDDLAGPRPSGWRRTRWSPRQRGPGRCPAGIVDLHQERAVERR